MRLPDKWYQKYKKDVARHKAAFGRNKAAKRLANSSLLFLWVVLSVLTLTVILIIGISK